MTLDTILVDTDVQRVFLSWRVVVDEALDPIFCAVRWPSWLTRRFDIDEPSSAPLTLAEKTRG